MFSFQQTDDLVFHQIPSSISFQPNQQDLLHHDDVAMEATTNPSSVRPRKRAGDQSPSKPNSGDSRLDEHTHKKLVHREIERQRRQEMAKLYASLRGLLPLQFIKGKRSTSDQMHQAVKYIKGMQQNIKVLSVKRDRLRKFVETISTETNANECLMNLVPNTVSITSCNAGIDILINSAIEDGFRLSGILKAVVEQGFNVITCSSTKVNQRFLHSIRSEVNDQVLTDLSLLQQRLTILANNY